MVGPWGASVKTVRVSAGAEQRFVDDVCGATDLPDVGVDAAVGDGVLDVVHVVGARVHVDGRTGVSRSTPGRRRPGAHALC